jgi:phosphoribosylformylglycinamidine synthase
VGEVPVDALTTLVPTYHPPQARPAYLDRTGLWSSDELPQPEDWQDTLKRLLASPNIASKEWVYRQYDHTILTSTVIHPGSDAALVRIKGTPRAIALSTDCNGRYCYLDPYTGGGLAVAEAARNVAVTGARPLAVTDCLNFGSPENPEIFYQFTQSVAGMSDACRALGTPVISGNVSFYNETEQGAVYPTPVVGMLGVLEDIDKRCTIGWKKAGDVIVQLGINAGDLGGSEYVSLATGEALGKPPTLDLVAEKCLIDCCLELIHQGTVRSAHDISDGGLAVAIAESCFLANQGATGASIGLDADSRPDGLLFGEAQARIIVSLDPHNLKALEETVARYGVPSQAIGLVTDETLSITVNGALLIQEKTSALQAVWQEAIPCIMK